LLMGLGFRPASAWQGADAGWRTYVWSTDPAPEK
jgi:hypothetical protein